MVKRQHRNISQTHVLRDLTPLAGALLLVAFAIASLPWGEGVFRRPRTPFDHSAASSVAPGFALLSSAVAVIPPGASVVARTEPPNAGRETYFHRFTLSLLPGRRVLPASYYGEFVPPEVWKDAEYLVVIGPKPAQAPGRLLLETPDGSVWRRARP